LYDKNNFVRISYNKINGKSRDKIMKTLSFNKKGVDGKTH